MQHQPIPAAPHTDVASPGLSHWTDSLLWFYLSLIVGLGSTAALFIHYVAVDRAAVQAQLQRGVESLASFATQPVPFEPILQMVNAITAAQSELHGGAELSEDLLQRHLLPNPAAYGFEAVSLGYLPRVAADGIDEYSAGFPIVEMDSTGRVSPAASRGEYFPVLLGAASTPEYMPLTGLDRAADAMHRLAMLQARDSGFVVVLTQFPLEQQPEPLITYFYLPVYRSGTTPATPEERRSQLTGLLSAVSYQDSTALFAFLSTTMHGIQAVYFPRSSSLQSDTDYEDLRRLIARREVATVDYTAFGLPFTLAGRAHALLADTLATSTRWWVLCIGLLLTSWFASMSLWFRNQSKRIKALVVARTQDLSERTAALAVANRALGESERRYRMLAEHATDVIYTCDLDGRYTYVSPSVEQQRGYTPEELIGTPIADLLPENEKRNLQARYVKARIAAREHPGQQPELADNKIEFQGYCKDGSLRWLETTVSYLYDADGRMTGVLGVSRDISERKRAEQEKETLAEAYRQAQKMEAIGTLAGGVAHDFNNLLTGIYGYADILRSQVGANPDAHGSIDIIEKAATRAQELTRQLLGFARKGGMTATLVDLNDSMLEVISLLSRTINRNITIEQQLSADKPTVLGDSGQLVHLLLNLGINARDAMPDGGTLTFSVGITQLDEQFCALHADLKPGTYCHITVRDTGVGMDKAKMARIFEPFYTDKEVGKGTGLGLAMVYGVACSHGGIVTVESEPGRGSTFHVFLPRREAD